MKIYAADKPLPITPFDEYIGKDLWVKCTLFHEDTVFLYVRFLDKFWFTLPSGTEKPVLHVTYIPEREVNLLRRTYPIGFADTVMVLLNQIHMVEPVEVISTERLYEYAEKRDLIHSIAGTDIWVEAYDGYSDGFVNIHKIEKDVVTYSIIGNEWLEDIERQVEFRQGDYNFILKHLDQPEHLHKKYIDGISIYEPINMLTAEEIREMLEQCPVEPEEDDE